MSENNSVPFVVTQNDTQAEEPPQCGQSNRFYPESVVPFEHEPTRDRFSIITTDEYGQGIISHVAFEPGEVVFRFTGELTPVMTLFTLQVRPGLHVHDPYVMGKVLHCCDPNMRADMSTLTFTATKPIQAGDFLTMDYETTEDELFRSFHCECGAPNCRHLIRGRNYVAQTPELVESTAST